MRTVMIAAASLALAATATTTELSAWSVPGWYQTADTIVGPFVWAGPFADEPTCRATLPPNEEDAEYKCEYLSEQPIWDK